MIVESMYINKVSKKREIVVPYKFVLYNNTYTHKEWKKH